ncbi:MAG: flippase-like domain-containing protein [Candidatus Pacebacteria bacterium]|nr:flippase-like domain-containing protein [Candidatus Paceibacterota bacterium]
MKRIIFLLSLILGLFLFVGAIQQAGIESVIQTIKIFPLPAILAVFLINFVAIFVFGTLRWKIIIEAQNSHKISFGKLLRAKLAGFAVSYITPSVLVGGEPVRAYMIKEESGYSWEKSFASVIIDQAIYFFSLFLFMIFGFLFLVHYFSLPVSVFYGFGFMIASAFFIFYLFYSRLIKDNSDGHGFFIFIIKTTRLDKIKFIGRKEENIERMEKIIAQFFNNKTATFIRAFILAFAEILLYLITVWIIILSLGKAIDLTYSAAIFFIFTLANLIPIPGSLGSFEASLTFIFNLLNLGKSNGFAFSLIFRLINITLVLLGFLSLIYFSIKTFSSNFSIETPRQLLKIHKFMSKVFNKK